MAFFKEDVAAVTRAKSAARAGSLGLVRVGDTGVLPWPWNWEERSSYWLWRFVFVEFSVAAALYSR